MLVCAFKGWNDAGEAASAALLHPRFFRWHDVAQIDPEEYYDFTAVRPIALTEGRQREWTGPTTRSRWPRSGADRDLVMLQGVEPSLRWRRFADNVIGRLAKLDVSMIITLGALLADVPHSRPVSITGIGSTAALVERLGFEPPSYEGRRASSGCCRTRSRRRVWTSVSLWASVPHYVAASPNPKVALALVRGFEGIAGVAVDAAKLESAAEDYERQVSAAVASDPEVKAFVERLETAVDEVQAENPPDEEDLPSADTIA